MEIKKSDYKVESTRGRITTPPPTPKPTPSPSNEQRGEKMGRVSPPPPKGKK